MWSEEVKMWIKAWNIASEMYFQAWGRDINVEDNWIEEQATKIYQIISENSLAM